LGSFFIGANQVTAYCPAAKGAKAIANGTMNVREKWTGGASTLMGWKFGRHRSG
jgi:hypothetical protein